MSFAQDCKYSLEENKTKLTWTAFKTPLKVGVSGSFDKLGVNKNVTGSSLSEMLENTTFNIETASVNSGDKVRDGKLNQFFFAPLSKNFKGKILSYKRKVLEVEINIAGQKMILPLKVTQTPDQVHAKGTLDILDISEGSKHLASINKACETLHEGKTWNDVELELKLNYLKSCK
tara:strand:+ start:8323 stop:8847 length:525 start_codon:yes stop_codon:yes gene_type:complete